MGNLEEICEQQYISVTVKFLCIKLWTAYIHAVTSSILGEILQISISPFGRSGEEEKRGCEFSFGSTIFCVPRINYYCAVFCKTVTQTSSE